MPNARPTVKRGILKATQALNIISPKPWDRVIKSCDGKVEFQFDANLRHQQVDTVIVAMVCDKNSALAQRYML